LRGRVNAVEMVFVSASNELGAFESGLAASLLGATRAVVLGGIATIGIAVGWTRLFPALAEWTGSRKSGQSRPSCRRAARRRLVACRRSLESRTRADAGAAARPSASASEM